MSRGKATTLPQIAQLIATGQRTAKERWDELKADFDQKHKENVDRRHALINSYSTLEGRVTVVETKLTSIVGDNSGESGLLHEINKKVDALKGEVQVIKQTVQDTPAINKWVYGAIAVIGALMFMVPIAVAILFELLKVLAKR
ncbi:MAG: hypothetical protein ACJ71S_06555 [Acidobacteriaceae bacterium]